MGDYYTAKLTSEDLKEFFQETNWERYYREETTVEDKWKTLLEMYNKGVDKYVPKFKFKVKYIKDWFNNKCGEARVCRDKA